LILIEKVARELGLDQLLGYHFGGLKKRARGLRVSRQILDLASMLIDGGERIEDMRQLATDKAWQTLRDKGGAMAPRTARDLLYRFTEETTKRFEKMESQMAQRVAKRIPEVMTATIDADATFIEARKKESKMSFKGAPGYYPMLGFWAETQLAIQGEFRQGNEAPSSKALAFLKKCERSIPKEIERRRVRADAAWFQAEVMDYCDGRSIDFAIGGTQNEAMMKVIDMIPAGQWESWTEDKGELYLHPERRDWEVAETVYSFEKSRKAYRVVVIRKPYPQLDMFKGIIYDYMIIVTNMEWEKRRVMRWYWERCNSENWIKELKYGFGLNQFPCSRELPNAAYFHIVLLAYNLVQALKLLKLDFGWRYMTVKTLRYHLLHVAGLVVRHARQWFLKIYYRYPHYNTFSRILCRTPL
jgi:hypothetical protein